MIVYKTIFKNSYLIQEYLFETCHMKWIGDDIKEFLDINNYIIADGDVEEVFEDDEEIFFIIRSSDISFSHNLPSYYDEFIDFENILRKEKFKKIINE